MPLPDTAGLFFQNGFAVKPLVAPAGGGSVRYRGGTGIKSGLGHFPEAVIFIEGRIEQGSQMRPEIMQFGLGGFGRTWSFCHGVQNGMIGPPVQGATGIFAHGNAKRVVLTGYFPDRSIFLRKTGFPQR